MKKGKNNKKISSKSKNQTKEASQALIPQHFDLTLFISS